MVLGTVSSLSANSYGSCPNCPSSGGYPQGQGYYQGQGQQGYYQGQGQEYQGGYSQGGNEGGYYKDGSRPVLVGTRPGQAQQNQQQYNQR